MSLAKLKTLFKTKPIEAPKTVSLVYSSITDKVRPYVHGDAAQQVTAAWLQANMAGQRFWDIILLAQFVNEDGVNAYSRRDVFNTRERGNTCTHEDLRELLNVEHEELVQELRDENFVVNHLYWLATPNASYIEDQHALQILTEVYTDEYL